MYVDYVRLLVLVEMGWYLDYALAVLLMLLVPAWFGARSSGNEHARWLLRILVLALAIWVFTAWLYGVALFATAGDGLRATLMLLAPLALVYGFGKARRRKARMATRGTGLGRTLLGLFPLPILVAVSLTLAIADRSIEDRRPMEWLYEVGLLDPAVRALPDGLTLGNGPADALLAVFVFFGYGALILFFLTVPYLMGSVVAAVLLILDRLGLKAILREREGRGDRPIES